MRNFIECYVYVLGLLQKSSSKKVKLWPCDEIHTLSAIVKTHPHTHLAILTLSAYAAFVHGVLHKWNYVMCMHY